MTPEDYARVLTTLLIRRLTLSAKAMVANPPILAAARELVMAQRELQEVAWKLKQARRREENE